MHSLWLIFLYRKIDGFLIQTLAVVFRETRTIQYNPNTCEASEQLPREVKFNLNSKDNRQPLSFVSYREITKQILPQLRGQLESKEAEKSVSATFIPQLESEIRVLEQGIAGWEKIIESYEETNSMASRGGLPSARDFFLERKNKFYHLPYCQKKRYSTEMSLKEIAQTTTGKDIEDTIGINPLTEIDKAIQSVSWETVAGVIIFFIIHSLNL